MIGSGLVAAVFLASLARADVLDDYVQRLRRDAAGERKETGFLSAGSEFLYGQDYFEAGKFTESIGYFRNALRLAPENAFHNYQLGAAQLKAGDKYARDEAMEHLEKAFRLNAALRDRYQREFAAAAAPAKPAPAAVGSLEAYIERLKKSRATGGAETAMSTPGLTALYGIEYYEQNQFDLAASRFRQVLAGQPDNAYAAYLLAVSLAAQGDDAAAAPILAQAVARDAALATRYAAESAAAKTAWQKILDARQPKTTPVTPAPAPGGALVFGNYTCSETVWNGPNTVPAFRPEYRGYFELKSDGTYRWLDNGETGRYRYDAQTGVVTWLSGRFAGGGALQSTIYRRSGANGVMTISFSANLRWEALCEKK